MTGNVATLNLPGMPPALPLIMPSAWDDKQPPDRMWLVDDWIPLIRATLLTGDGGTGKSLLGQQLATCIAMGLPFMGKSTRQMRTLYLTCEDDRAELWRRQDAINQSLGISMRDTDRNLYLASRFGEIDSALLHFDHEGTAFETPFMASLRQTANDNAILFVVLDNIAHLFSGNENHRPHVAAFASALDRLALNLPGAVLFIGHPPKSGAQFSGSTAWENQVRSRLFLERGDEMDPDSRMLTRSKSNYSKAGDTIKLRWQHWAFVPDDADSITWQAEMRASAAAVAENERFIELLQERDKQGRPVSGRTQSRNYAPREFARMPAARGMKIEQFERAMERLFGLGRIEEIEAINPKDRHPYRRIAETCGPVAGQTPSMSGDGGEIEAKSKISGCGPVDCGPVAGQSLRPISLSAETGSSEGFEGAGQLRASYAGEGGGEAPLIGGLSPPPPLTNSDDSSSDGWDV